MTRSQDLNVVAGYRRRGRFGAVALAAIAMALLPVVAPAATTGRDPEILTLEEAAKLLRVEAEVLESLARHGNAPGRRIGGAWRFSRTALLAWLGAPLPKTAPALAELDLGGYLADAAPSGAKMRVAELSRVVGRGSHGSVHPADAREGQVATTQSEPVQPVGEPPPLPTAEEVFLRDQRVLLAPGQVGAELGLFYTKQEDKDICVVSADGDLVSLLAEIEQDTYTASLTLRYGLFEETEAFADVSVFHEQNKETTFGLETEDDRSQTGDVVLGARHTLIREAPWVPDVIVSVEGVIPTEDSSYGVGGGLAIVKSFDPAVLFANVGYRHTFSRDFADLTLLQPEEMITATAGYAFALNDTLTLSAAVSGIFTGRTSFGNAVLPQRERFSLRLGLTTLLSEDLYVEPVVSFGLSGNESNVTLGLSVPYTFAP